VFGKESLRDNFENCAVHGILWEHYEPKKHIFFFVKNQNRFKDEYETFR
jgi:hypothetical protein